MSLTSRQRPVRHWLRKQHGRCVACGFHLHTQGHEADCPLGPRARFSLDADGKVRGTSRRGPE